MIKKLRRKFIWVTMSIITAMLVVIFLLTYHFTAQNLSNQASVSLDTLLNSSQPTQVPLPFFTVTVGPWGDLLVSGATSLNIEDKSFVRTLVDTVNARGVRGGTIAEYSLQYRVRSGPMEQKIAFVDISGHSATLWALVQISLLVGALSLAIFFGLSILLARWAVAPVEDAWQKQKQFLSDASHELKTPLTVIMSNAELLQDADLQTDDHARYCGNILSMSQQMRHLVEGMLELTRADNGRIKTFFRPISLSNAVEQAALPFEPLFFERDLQLQISIAPDLSLTGSEQHLQQVVEILLDNAYKYSAPGIVNLSLTRQGHSALLSVSNPGAPIPPEEHNKIFQRFYRADEARTRDGSFGLGLAIAKAIVADHGGKIWVHSNDSGNCFFVQLPL